MTVVGLHGPAVDASLRHPRVSLEAIDLSRRAVDGLVESTDERLRLLGQGARHVMDQCTDSARAGTVEAVPGPVLVDLRTALAIAGKVAAGVIPWHATVTGDASRLMGVGAEGWLRWAFVPGAAMPLWLIPGMPDTEIHRSLA